MPPSGPPTGPIVRQKRGARALLFDRLMTRERTGDGLLPVKTPARDVYDMAELRESIAEQLGWLLNTRVPHAYPVMDARTRTGTRSTVDYGLPDLTVYPIGDSAAMARLAEHLTQTVGIYELRLRHPQVRIAMSEQRGDTLIVRVTGEIGIAAVVEPVSFAFPLSVEGARDGS